MRSAILLVTGKMKRNGVKADTSWKIWVILIPVSKY